MMTVFGYAEFGMGRKKNVEMGYTIFVQPNRTLLILTSIDKQSLSNLVYRIQILKV